MKSMTAIKTGVILLLNRDFNDENENFVLSNTNTASSNSASCKSAFSA